MGCEVPTRYQKGRPEPTSEKQGKPLHYKEKLTIEKMSDGDILVGRGRELRRPQREGVARFKAEDGRGRGRRKRNEGHRGGAEGQTD